MASKHMLNWFFLLKSPNGDVNESFQIYNIVIYYFYWNYWFYDIVPMPWIFFFFWNCELIWLMKHWYLKEMKQNPSSSDK